MQKNRSGATHRRTLRMGLRQCERAPWPKNAFVRTLPAEAVTRHNVIRSHLVAQS